MNRKDLKLLYAFILVIFFACKHGATYTTWQQYNGSDENIHYSSLTQVDTGNVKELQVAWEYHSGDIDTANHSQMQCNAIMIDGVLYGTTPQMKLFAIDASTGKEKWQFNPFDSLAGNKKMFFILNNCRGVTYWSDGNDDKRIFYTAGSDLYCINAISGSLVKDFGDKGKIDLHEGLDRDVKDLFVTATSPGIIYKDLIIMGSRVDEGAAAAPGHIRAYNVRTGKRYGYFIPYRIREKKAMKPGTILLLINLSVAPMHGVDSVWINKEELYLHATGSASYDFYGGRRTGNNLFADCLLALDAATGKRIWHFQDLHHDVWDRDLSSPPALVRITKDGNKIDAVALTTKSGFIYLFERATGKPVYDIEGSKSTISK